MKDAFGIPLNTSIIITIVKEWSETHTIYYSRQVYLKTSRTTSYAVGLCMFGKSSNIEEIRSCDLPLSLSKYSCFTQFWFKVTSYHHLICATRLVIILFMLETKLSISHPWPTYSVGKEIVYQTHSMP